MDKTRGISSHFGSGTLKRERAIVVGVYRRKEEKSLAEETLRELEELARSAGAEVVGWVLQRRQRFDPGFLLGKGKIQEIANMAEELQADLVLFDETLSPAQHRNIDEVIPCKVLDRTQLILDIFSQRAISKEGKLQVELAQLNYLLPRLIGIGKKMSRLGGGIGTRGPGEKKLEYDRRRIGERIKRIKMEIEEIKKRRQQQRKHRKKTSIPTVALVGYTSAGKTTLFNKLTGENLRVSRALFTTLDPILRRITLPSGLPAILSDTVGFIRKLPVELVTAFRATLEETVEADLLLHVVDFSKEDYREEELAVEKTLQDLGASNKPLIKVYNKIDLLDAPERFLERNSLSEDRVYISAKMGWGIEDLLRKIDSKLLMNYEIETIFYPYSERIPWENLSGESIILERKNEEEGIRLKLAKRRVR